MGSVQMQCKKELSRLHSLLVVIFFFDWLVGIGGDLLSNWKVAHAFVTTLVITCVVAHMSSDSRLLFIKYNPSITIYFAVTFLII